MTTNNNTGDSTTTPTNNNNNAIHPATLLELHKLGFKLVPLSNTHRPVLKWAEIRDNPNFWSPEKLTDQSPLFQNVATAYY
jgi:hypothetical protein